MPFVQAKCPNCGGILAVDNTNDAAVCPFCNTPYVVEKAIYNYNVHNTVSVGAGAVVNVYGSVNDDFDIVAGVLEEYDGAETHVIIPNSVKSIGEEAFECCSDLSSVTIPDSVTSIGKMAFYDCSSLTSINIPNSVTSIGSYAFYNCSSLKSITIPDSVTSIGSSAFYNCSGLTSVTIPDSVKSIGESAFMNCSSLTSITIGSAVTNIEQGAFSGCSKIKSITIPDSVTSIGCSAFGGCGELTNIDIPTSVISIGNGAFSGCRGLTRVTIGNSVKTIGCGAFRSCSKLTSITIPESVTKIDKDAFEGCSGLTSAKILGTPQILVNAFRGCDNLIDVQYSPSLQVPQGTFSAFWKKNNRCSKCGGTFNLLRECSNCGKKRKYNADINNSNQKKTNLDVHDFIFAYVVMAISCALALWYSCSDLMIALLYLFFAIILSFGMFTNSVDPENGFHWNNIFSLIIFTFILYTKDPEKTWSGGFGALMLSILFFILPALFGLFHILLSKHIAISGVSFIHVFSMVLIWLTSLLKEPLSAGFDYKIIVYIVFGAILLYSIITLTKSFKSKSRWLIAAPIVYLAGGLALYNILKLM